MEKAHHKLSNGVGRIFLDQLLREILRKTDEKIAHFRYSILWIFVKKMVDFAHFSNLTSKNKDQQKNN